MPVSFSGACTRCGARVTPGQQDSFGHCPDCQTADAANDRAAARARASVLFYTHAALTTALAYLEQRQHELLAAAAADETGYLSSEKLRADICDIATSLLREEAGRVADEQRAAAAEAAAYDAQLLGGR